MLLQPIGVVRPGIKVLIRLEAYEEHGKVVCLLHTLSGEIKLGPKAWLKAVRDEIWKLENIARNADCAEMRIEGRDWSRVLKGLGYLPWPEGDGFGLRKVL
jgi:hypothetical protein